MNVCVMNVWISKMKGNYKMKTYFISKEKFIEWYFQDADDYGRIGHSVVEMLLDDGKAEMTIQDLWDGCGSYPSWILSNWEGEENVYLEDIDGIDGFDLENCEFEFEEESK